MNIRSMVPFHTKIGYEVKPNEPKCLYFSAKDSLTQNPTPGDVSAQLVIVKAVSRKLIESKNPP